MDFIAIGSDVKSSKIYVKNTNFKILNSNQ